MLVNALQGQKLRFPFCSSHCITVRRPFLCFPPIGAAGDSVKTLLFSQGGSHVLMEMYWLYWEEEEEEEEKNAAAAAAATRCLRVNRTHHNLIFIILLSW